MSFIVKMGVILVSLVFVIVIHFFSFDFEAKKDELKRASGMFYEKPSFMFYSNHYKEFVYAK